MGEITADHLLKEYEDVKKRKLLRGFQVIKPNNQTFGFHLSRSPWDPYPWVSNVDRNSPAAEAGLHVGDFVIEVNQRDILGLNIEEIANEVRSISSCVNLMVWKSGITEKEALSSAAFNLQKFSQYVETTIQLIECPICLGIPTTPTFQCLNGHILCNNCRLKTTKCPMCRAVLSNRSRSLLAEKLYRLYSEIFAMNRNSLTCSPVMEKGFPCPWIGPCRDIISDTKHLWKHLKGTHQGPIIKFCTKNQKINFTLLYKACAIILEDNEGNLFFVRTHKSKFTLCFQEESKSTKNFTFVSKGGTKPVSSIWDSWHSIESVHGFCKLPNDMNISIKISYFDDNKNKIY